MITCSFPGCEAHQLMRLANTADNRVVLVCERHYAWGMAQVGVLRFLRTLFKHKMETLGVPQEDPEGSVSGTIYASDKAVPRYEERPGTRFLGDIILEAYRNSLH